MLARAVAPGMTPSNSFRIDPGPGTALIKVDGGSNQLRTLGIIGMAAGIPIALTGMGLFSYGRVEDDSGLTTAGAIVLGTGAVIALVALPLLFSGKTSVQDGKGKLIATRDGAPASN
jgi:hypothetical protein